MWPFTKAAPKTAPEPSYAERLERQELTALEHGSGTLWPESNIAPGTPGYAMYALEFRGLMRKTTTLERISPIRTDFVTRFALTDAGRAAQAMMRD